MSAADDLQRLSSQFAAIAAAIDGHGTDAAVTEALHTTRTATRTMAQSRAPAGVTSLAANLSTALDAWESVWPRLGQRAEFRQAVIREATMWSKRLAALATEQPPG